MFIVVSYDVADDKRRGRVAAVLESTGKRVQYSVFECILTRGQLRDLRKKLLPILNLKADSVRFYFLDREAVREIRVLGRGSVTSDEALFVV